MACLGTVHQRALKDKAKIFIVLLFNLRRQLLPSRETNCTSNASWYNKKAVVQYIGYRPPVDGYQGVPGSMPNSSAMEPGSTAVMRWFAIFLNVPFIIPCFCPPANHTKKAPLCNLQNGVLPASGALMLRLCRYRGFLQRAGAWRCPFSLRRRSSPEHKRMTSHNASITGTTSAQGSASCPLPRVMEPQAWGSTPNK